jgi:hypothetical protein
MDSVYGNRSNLTGEYIFENHPKSLDLPQPCAGMKILSTNRLNV